MKKTWKWIVPIILGQKEEYFKEYLKMLKEMRADMVLMAGPFPEANVLGKEQWRRYSGILKQRTRFFDANGIKSGFWMARTLGHSSSFSSTGRRQGLIFQELVGPKGQTAHGCYCPLDNDFKKYMAQAVKQIAGSGVKFILLDDDFRMSLHGEEARLSCFCPLHIKKFNKLAKMNLSREQLVKKVICGKPNKTREKWLKLTGESLIGMAKVIEKAAHSVDKKIRIGQCASPSHWCSEGFNMIDLLRTLAGKTSPFVRICGAPYWAKDSTSLSHILEYNRLEYNWIKKHDIEVVAEGDTFPHTRFYCSAIMFHSYTQFIIAAGIPGILDYAIAYSQKPDHETAYVQTAAKYIENYAAIRKFFPEKYIDKGLNIIINQNYNKNISASTDIGKAISDWQTEYMPPVLMGISRLGIPLMYNEGTGPVLLSGHMVFNLNDKELKKILKQGVVVDAVAAEWLMKKGIDIGIKSIQKAKNNPVLEHYNGIFNGKHEGSSTWLLNYEKDLYYEFEPGVKAVIASKFQDDNRKEMFPGTILYENARGQRFCILPYDMKKVKGGIQLLLGYAKQHQLAECISWVGKKPLPVFIRQPDVHIMCKTAKDESRIAIAVQNCHQDTLDKPVLLLNPDIKVGKKIELLLPDSKKSFLSSRFEYKNDGKYGYLKIMCKVRSLELLCVGLKQK